MKNKEEPIQVERFSALAMGLMDCLNLKKGTWLINKNGLKELVIDYHLIPGYASLKTLMDVSGHVRIIQEESYESENASRFRALFKRGEPKKFLEGEPGYEERAKLMKDAGYDMNKPFGRREE